MCVSACFVSWVGPPNETTGEGPRRATSSCSASVAVILCAADAFTFLFAWEILTVSFYMLTSVTRAEARQAGAAWSTVGIGKVERSRAALRLLAHGRAHPQSEHRQLARHRSRRRPRRGLGAGRGRVRGQGGSGAAPGLDPGRLPGRARPARAAMAGIAANVGVYGLWRFLGVLGRPPVWLVIAVLLVGGVTALLGHHLRRASRADSVG